MASATNRSAAGAVVAVAVLQLVVVVFTTAVWIANTIFAGGACGLSCDWAAAEVAARVYFLVALAMFLCTGATVVFAWRTGKALMWVPLAASVGIIAGLIIALNLFHDAMS